MRSGGRDFLRLCGVAIVVGGLAAALTLLFIPLSVQRASSGQVTGWCGPGFHSDNALQVRIDPGIVNTGGGGPTVPAVNKPGHSAIGGRGLGIVDRLALRWGVCSSPDGTGETTVWAELALSPDKPDEHSDAGSPTDRQPRRLVITSSRDA